MTTSLDEARDWQGREIPHLALRGADRCRCEHGCVNDRYARRIDRFFACNPELADDYLAHPYFEAPRAPRLAPSQLLAMVDDPEPKVRSAVAARIGLEWVSIMATDHAAGARPAAAARLSAAQLVSLRCDRDWPVRYEVASRVVRAVLPEMTHDSDPLVRDCAQRRLGRCGELQP